MMVSVINWILGLLGLLCTIGIIVGFPAVIIALIVELSKQVPEGQTRSLKWTKIFGLSFVGAMILLVLILVIWGILIYVINAL